MSQGSQSDSDRMFHSTHLSILEEAGREQKLERFVRFYHAPLALYLKKSMKLDSDRVDDLLQQFILEKFLPQDPNANIAAKYLARSAQDPSLRFRRYLLRSMRNFVISSQRGKETFRDLPDVIESYDEDRFAIDWANNLLDQAIDQVKTECYLNEQGLWWQIFEARNLKPIFHGAPTPSYGELTQRYQLSNLRTVWHALTRVRMKFDKTLRALVRGYLPQAGNDAIQQEINDLASTLRASSEWSARVDEQLSPSVLLELDQSFDTMWSDEDLKDIWRQLMSVPLPTLLSDAGQDSLAARVEQQFPDLTNLTALWTCDAPPADVIDALRRWGKGGVRANGRMPRTVLELEYMMPTKVSFVLYIACIVVSRLRLSRPMTKMSRSQVEANLDLALRQDWIDDLTRKLLRDGCEAFRASDA